VCIKACMHACVWGLWRRRHVAVYVHACIHVCMPCQCYMATNTYMRTYIHTHIHNCKHTRIAQSGATRLHTHTYIHTFLVRCYTQHTHAYHANMHTFQSQALQVYIHTYTYTYTHSTPDATRPGIGSSPSANSGGIVSRDVYTALPGRARPRESMPSLSEQDTERPSVDSHTHKHIERSERERDEGGSFDSNQQGGGHFNVSDDGYNNGRNGSLNVRKDEQRGQTQTQTQTPSYGERREDHVHQDGRERNNGGNVAQESPDVRGRVNAPARDEDNSETGRSV
jgi:hypothetical protein